MNSMNIITKAEFFSNKQKYFQMIRDGALFVYPTDTIYGIGCDAQNKAAVAAITRLKQRPKTSQFSLIVPSKQWVHDHCIITPRGEEWVAKLPGPYTLILPKNDGTTVGVRIPQHWISQAVQELGICIITTSVNRSGSPPIVKIGDIPPQMKKKISFCIDEGQLQGSPSMLVYLNQDNVHVQQR